METGEKGFEIRRDSKWIRSRLFNKDGTPKHYDLIHYTNGYGKTKPYFIVEFKDVDRFVCFKTFSFSNGFSCCANEGDWCINHGKVLESGNLKEKVKE